MTNILKFGVGGIDQIHCLINQKVYFGQSSSILERSGRHLTLLNNNCHECLQLQTDWNQFGIHNFELTILIVEESLTKRLELERQYIQNLGSDLCYNVIVKTGFQSHQTSQKIAFNGNFFMSIREAERVTRVSKTTIIRKLANPEEKDCYRLEKIPLNRGKYNFIINNKIYSSTREVLAANLAQTDDQVRQRCRSNSSKWCNWQMVQKKRSNDYPDGE